MTMYKTKLTDKQEINEKTHVVAKHTVTLPPHHMSIVPLTPINYTGNIQANTPPEVEENPFFLIGQQNITIIPALQKLGSRTPDEFFSNNNTCNLMTIHY